MGSIADAIFSIGVLQAAVRVDENAFRFDPPLSTEKETAIMSPTVVYYAKVHLIFETNFWNETEEDQQYASTEQGYYPYYILDTDSPTIITVNVEMTWLSRWRVNQ